MANKKIYKGVDISRHNKMCSDFKALKDDGYDFVIIRIGGSNGGHYKDPKFDEYYNKAKKARLKVGCYYDTGREFHGMQAGLDDAGHMLKLMQGYQFDYPVYMDIETAATVYKSDITQAAIAFGNHLEQNGYFVGIYASDISGFKDRLFLDKVERFTLWVARYGKEPQYVKNYAIWQKSSKGVIRACQNYIDIDESYVNFSTIIKKKHLNGY